MAFQGAARKPCLGARPALDFKLGYKTADAAPIEPLSSSVVKAFNTKDFTRAPPVMWRQGLAYVPAHSSWKFRKGQQRCSRLTSSASRGNEVRSD